MSMYPFPSAEKARVNHGKINSVHGSRPRLTNQHIYVSTDLGIVWLSMRNLKTYSSLAIAALKGAIAHICQFLNHAAHLSSLPTTPMPSFEMTHLVDWVRD